MISQIHSETYRGCYQSRVTWPSRCFPCPLRGKRHLETNICSHIQTNMTTASYLCSIFFPRSKLGCNVRSGPKRFFGCKGARWRQITSQEATVLGSVYVKQEVKYLVRSLAHKDASDFILNTCVLISLSRPPIKKALQE